MESTGQKGNKPYYKRPYNNNNPNRPQQKKFYKRGDGTSSPGEGGDGNSTTPGSPASPPGTTAATAAGAAAAAATGGAVVDENLLIPAPKTKTGPSCGGGGKNKNYTSDGEGGNKKAGAAMDDGGDGGGAGEGAEGKSNRQRRYEKYQERRQEMLKQRREQQQQQRQTRRAGGSAQGGQDGSRASSNHPRDPAVDAAAATALTFPSTPAATVEELGGPAPTGAPAVSRAQGGGAAHTGALGPTHPTRLLMLDPGNVFPNAPFVAVGDITGGSALKAFTTSVHHAVNNTSHAVTAAPKFAHLSALTPMEPEPRASSLVPAYTTHVYRSSNRFSGTLVCLRRVVGCSAITAERCAAVQEYMRHFRHPNLAQLTGVSGTTEFNLGSPDVLLEYRFVKGARNLAEVVGAREELTESCVWSIGCQLLSLVRHFHECEVPLRGLHISKLLLVQDIGDGIPSSNGGSQRVVFTGLGLVDVLGTSDVPPLHTSLTQLYRSDIQAVGTILQQLVHGSLNIDRSANVQSSPIFTPALFAFVRSCRDGTHTAPALCRALGERMASELSNSLAHSDYLLSEAAKEIHCGRIMKLLMRLNFAYAASMQLQQQHVDFDSLFVVRLFFQHLFAQVDEHGTPQLDWGLVYHGLNKVDVGSADLVQLVSDQDHTLVVVSYKDVARCIEVLCEGLLSSIKEAAAGHHQQQHQQQQQGGGGMLGVGQQHSAGSMVGTASGGGSSVSSPASLASGHGAAGPGGNNAAAAAAAAALAAAGNPAVNNLLAGIVGAAVPAGGGTAGGAMGTVPTFAQAAQGAVGRQGSLGNAQQGSGQQQMRGSF